MKCNIWISNTSYIFEYYSISFHEKSTVIRHKAKRTLTKYIKLQAPLSPDPRDTLKIAIFTKGQIKRQIKNLRTKLERIRLVYYRISVQQT